MRAQSVCSHPLTEKRELEHVLGDLARCAPEKTLCEIAPWLDSLIGNPDLDRAERSRLLFALDEASQRAARQCVDLYLAACHGPAQEARRLWAMVQGHWTLLLDAYGELLAGQAAEREFADPAMLAQVCVRAMRAASNLAKWDAFCHGPIGDGVWARLNLAYRLAVRAEAVNLTVRFRPERETSTTVAREYLRAIALHSAGLDQLDADRLELASRLVHYVLPKLELAACPSTVTLFWIDAMHALPPARLVKLPLHAGLPRFFSGVAAVVALQELLELASVGSVPPGLVLRHAVADSQLTSVLSHLIRQWGGDAPVRRHRRHPMPGRLWVVKGPTALAACLAGALEEAQPRDWCIRDVSRQGVGVDVPSAEAEGFEVGCLVGLCSADGDRWRVGAVRRLWRARRGQSEIGIEVLGEAPLVALADDGQARIEVILLDSLKPGLPVRLALPLAALCGERPLFLLGRNAAVKLVPLPQREFGVDHEIRTYLCAPN